MEVNNIFDYCLDDITCNDVFYFINTYNYGNACINMAFNNDGKLLKYSNDWLYLISVYYNSINYSHHTIYHEIKDVYNNAREMKEIIYLNEDVIPFVTSFSRGTAHGYTGLFDILYEYLTNKNIYKHYKIAVYSKSQGGILEIIEHLCENGFIDREKIFFIDSGIKYHFKSIHLIKVKNHLILPNNLNIMNLSNLISSYWLKPPAVINNKICIIKNTNSINITNMCFINNDVVERFCNKYNLFNCNPGLNCNENDLIAQLQNCEIFITTYGTSYQKNYYYVSEKCKYIIVLFNKSLFDIGAYPDKDAHLSEWCSGYFRNAQILYQVIDDTGGDIILTPEIEKVLV